MLVMSVGWIGGWAKSYVQAENANILFYVLHLLQASFVTRIVDEERQLFYQNKHLYHPGVERLEQHLVLHFVYFATMPLCCVSQCPNRDEEHKISN